jgi:hypothetical protein
VVSLLLDLFDIRLVVWWLLSSHPPQPPLFPRAGRPSAHSAAVAACVPPLPVVVYPDNTRSYIPISLSLKTDRAAQAGLLDTLQSEADLISNCRPLQEIAETVSSSTLVACIHHRKEMYKKMKTAPFVGDRLL